MDTLEAMATCRAIRYLRPDPLPDDIVETILHAATRAPSPGNTQEWDFVVVDDADLRRRIGEAVAPNLVPRVEKMPRPDRTARLMLDGVEHMARTLAECPVIVFVCGAVKYPPSAPMEKFTWSAVYPAAQNLIVAARALGVGSVFTTIQLNAEPQIREILGIPDEVLIGATIPLGWPDAEFGPVRRRPLSDFVHRNGWQGELRA
ncbi:MAG: nitroreductase family protein [Acidimicrobiales bacterium]